MVNEFLCGKSEPFVFSETNMDLVVYGNNENKWIFMEMKSQLSDSNQQKALSINRCKPLVALATGIFSRLFDNLIISNTRNHDPLNLN
jgi:hypothetical protein